MKTLRSEGVKRANEGVRVQRGYRGPSVNLDKTFFHSHEQKKGGKRRKKVKRSKAKKFRVSSKKVQILKLCSIGKVAPA